MDEYVEAIVSESDRFAELIPQSDLDAPVPSCPDWAFRDLVLHLGGVQRFWAENLLAANAAEPWNGERVNPSSDEDFHAWFQSGSLQLADAVRHVAPESPCWTWWGEPLTARAVARHQVQEAAVHRWDAELCSGAPSALDRSIANDGVDEYLAIMLGKGADQLVQAVELVAADTDSTWRVGPGGSPDATITATAGELVLLLYRRIPASQVQVDGDLGAAETLFTL